MHVSCTWARVRQPQQPQLWPARCCCLGPGHWNLFLQHTLQRLHDNCQNRVDRSVTRVHTKAVALLCAAQQLSALTFVSLCCAGFLLCCLCLQTTGPAAPANMRGNVHPGATWTNTHTSPLLATTPSRCAGHGSCPAAAQHRLCRTAAAHLIVVPAVIAAQACHTPAHHAVVQDACTVQGLPGVQQPAKPFIDLLCADIMPACSCALTSCMLLCAAAR